MSLAIRLTTVLIAAFTLAMITGCASSPEPETVADPPTETPAATTAMLEDPDLLCEAGMEEYRRGSFERAAICHSVDN